MRCCCSNCGWLEVNLSGAMFCGYSDERTSENESCSAWKEKADPQTNADRIRAMTDEELAKWITYPKQLLYCCFEFGDCGDDCSECALKWLKKEVEDGSSD